MEFSSQELSSIDCRQDCQSGQASGNPHLVHQGAHVIAGNDMIGAIGAEIDRLELEIRQAVPGIRHIDLVSDCSLQAISSVLNCDSWNCCKSLFAMLKFDAIHVELYLEFASLSLMRSYLE